MSDPRNTNKPVKAQWGWFDDLLLNMKLIVRLIADNRVSPFLKVIPFGSIIYLLNPIDIPGPLDDAAIVGMAFYLFIELCPEEVVEEHRRRLRNVVPGEFVPPRQSSQESSEVIEAEFEEIKEEEI